jgi:hypothetical protein
VGGTKKPRSRMPGWVGCNGPVDQPRLAVAVAVGAAKRPWRVLDLRRRGQGTDRLEGGGTSANTVSTDH